MECPRCGAEDALARYALVGGDREAAVCERCGYAGVPVDHGSEPRDRESWEAALRRFFGENEGENESGSGSGSENAE